jgi:hypothetical protein
MTAIHFLRPRLLVWFLLPLVLSGCELLFPSFVNPGDIGPPKLKATYVQGSATLKITTNGTPETVKLTKVSAGSQLMSMVGANVIWRNADGWIVQLQAFDPAEVGGGFFPGGLGAQLAIERVNGHEYWTTLDYSAADRCIVTIDEVSADAARGSATCKGLRWVDGIAANGFGFGGIEGPPYIEGQAPFDLEATFAATP